GNYVEIAWLMTMRVYCMLLLTVMLAGSVLGQHGLPMQYLAQLTELRTKVKQALNLSHFNKDLVKWLPKKYDGPDGNVLVHLFEHLFLMDDEMFRVTLDPLQTREYEFFKWGLRSALKQTHRNQELMERLSRNYGGAHAQSMLSVFKILFH
ncbi:hypothetical protein Ciccas_013554, partial [Cichlidogyrus casuarinus]